MSVTAQWTEEQMNNAMIYGICLVCLTPQEMSKTVTKEGDKTTTHFALIRPCGHTESEIDHQLAAEDGEDAQSTRERGG